MNHKYLAAVVSLSLAGVAAPASAGGIDVHIGLGYPGVVEYHDYYPPAQYYDPPVQIYSPPVQYYYRERRPVYRVNEYNSYYYGGNWRPAYYSDRDHHHDRYCHHDEGRSQHYDNRGGNPGHYDRWRGRGD